MDLAHKIVKSVRVPICNFQNSIWFHIKSFEITEHLNTKCGLCNFLLRLFICKSENQGPPSFSYNEITFYDKIKPRFNQNISS